MRGLPRFSASVLLLALAGGAAASQGSDVGDFIPSAYITLDLPDNLPVDSLDLQVGVLPSADPCGPARNVLFNHQPLADGGKGAFTTLRGDVPFDASWNLTCVDVAVDGVQQQAQQLSLTVDSVMGVDAATAPDGPPRFSLLLRQTTITDLSGPVTMVIFRERNLQSEAPAAGPAQASPEELKFRIRELQDLRVDAAQLERLIRRKERRLAESHGWVGRGESRRRPLRECSSIGCVFGTLAGKIGDMATAWFEHDLADFESFFTGGGPGHGRGGRHHGHHRWRGPPGWRHGGPPHHRHNHTGEDHDGWKYPPPWHRPHKHHRPPHWPPPGEDWPPSPPHHGHRPPPPPGDDDEDFPPPPPPPHHHRPPPPPEDDMPPPPPPPFEDEDELRRMMDGDEEWNASTAGERPGPPPHTPEPPHAPDAPEAPRPPKGPEAPKPPHPPHEPEGPPPHEPEGPPPPHGPPPHDGPPHGPPSHGGPPHGGPPHGGPHHGGPPPPSDWAIAGKIGICAVLLACVVGAVHVRFCRGRRHGRKDRRRCTRRRRCAERRSRFNRFVGRVFGRSSDDEDEEKAVMLPRERRTRGRWLRMDAAEPDSEDEAEGLMVDVEEGRVRPMVQPVVPPSPTSAFAEYAAAGDGLPTYEAAADEASSVVTDGFTRYTPGSSGYTPSVCGSEGSADALGDTKG